MLPVDESLTESMGVRIKYASLCKDTLLRSGTTFTELMSPFFAYVCLQSSLKTTKTEHLNEIQRRVNEVLVQIFHYEAAAQPFAELLCTALLTAALYWAWNYV